MITIPTRKPFNESDAGDLLAEATFESKDVTNRNRSAADSTKQTRKKLGILTIAKATEKRERDELKSLKKIPHKTEVEKAKTSSGSSSYLVSRGFLHNGVPAQHLFIVTDAKFIGDPDATVISFGKLANGKLGRLMDARKERVTTPPSKAAKDTHGNDRTFWEDLKDTRRRLPISHIDAFPLVVRQLASTLKENKTYSLLGINSNSAAIAIARRASRGKSTATPNDGFIQGATGFKEHTEIEFRGGP